MGDFTQVRRMSVSEEVFNQIAGQILDGTLTAGAALPSERSLTGTLGVNRQALREALQRLSQLGLVDIRHGGATRVSDFRSTAGLDLLPMLLIRPDGTIDPRVVGSMMEMRTAVGANAAALCAERADEECARALRRMIAEPEPAADGPGEHTLVSDRFWDLIVEGSGNICYRLSLNALRASYEQAESMVSGILAPEYSAAHLYRDIIEAVLDRDPERARTAATTLLERGAAAMDAFFKELEDR
jgi:GntR family transcriptional regulator, transcriptional repressor for pyruvate dehydrogenase complex